MRAGEIYLLVVNVIAFCLYGSDKKRAERHEYRISEKTLILMGVIGGGPGCFLGMQIFHHKTRKAKFNILIPLTILAWGYIIKNIL